MSPGKPHLLSTAPESPPPLEAPPPPPITLAVAELSSAAALQPPEPEAGVVSAAAEASWTSFHAPLPVAEEPVAAPVKDLGAVPSDECAAPLASAVDPSAEETESPRLADSPAPEAALEAAEHSRSLEEAPTPSQTAAAAATFGTGSSSHCCCCCVRG